MMKGPRSSGRSLLVLPLLLLFLSVLSTVADAQGLPESLSHGTPANDCGCPPGNDTIPVSSGMLTPFLPKIPNLEFGFLYSFGKNVRTSRFTADYVLPFKLSADSVLFGEAHAEGWDFWKRPSVSVAAPPPFTVTTSVTSNRVDLSFGGGYRTMLGDGVLLGVNGFYDSSRVFNKWYSSGGVGLEMAATVGGDDAVDVNFNWYGNLLNRDVLVNAFRNKGNSFDVEAGYSHALFDHALDLRLKLVGYQFDIGTPVQGWRGGADLTTRDGMFTLRYEHGRDPINRDYNTVGGFVTVGLQLENLLSGQSPFTFPEPVFRSPRDLRRLLGLKVKRNWHQPEPVVAIAPHTCPNLRGLVHIASSIDKNEPLFVDQIPTLTTTVNTICWCNLLAPARILVRIECDTIENATFITMIKPTDCYTVAYLTVDVHPPNSLRFDGGSGDGPFPLLFGPGGGISLQVNQ
jgi:hypothetical protein